MLIVSGVGTWNGLWPAHFIRGCFDQVKGAIGGLSVRRLGGDTIQFRVQKSIVVFLPEDLIPCWDMLFAPESGEPRDSSSAAIVACGLLEAAKYVDETEAAQWRTLARQMLASLAANYAVKPGTLGSGQLLHGTYSKKSPYNTCTPEGVDECTSWGDYFYMEALTRLTKDWEMYW